ncbi:hypothetical protein J6590_069713 [Homalodisca vitripennis]|nr:hypothetical protein J6590_069713 [Homalodisca vitripennis]
MVGVHCIYKCIRVLCNLFLVVYQVMYLVFCRNVTTPFEEISDERERSSVSIWLLSLHEWENMYASPAAAAPACASHSSLPCLPAAALDSTSYTQPPLTAPGPHPVGAYSETAAQELTTNGIGQKHCCLLTEVKVG